MSTHRSVSETEMSSLRSGASIGTVTSIGRRESSVPLLTTEPTPVSLSELSSIQQNITRLNHNVTNISTLRKHIRTRNTEEEEAKLDVLVVETQTLCRSLKDRIKMLECTPVKYEPPMWKNWIEIARLKFLDVVNNYRRLEEDYWIKLSYQIEHQFRLVKPHATPEEIAQLVAGGGQQIFAQAVTSRQQHIYWAVQKRQQERKKSEQTLTDLIQLLIDMGFLVRQEDGCFRYAELSTNDADVDTERALKHRKNKKRQGGSSGRTRRLFFFLAIITVVGLGIAIVLAVAYGGPWAHQPSSNALQE